MSNYYVALFDCNWKGESYNRGEIVTAERGDSPPAVEWVNFTPPNELSGTPNLAHIADDGSGDIVFRYTIAETKKTFILKARVGLPAAILLIGKDKRASAGAYIRQERTDKPVLRFGAGLATTSSRGYVGWTGRSRPTPSAQPEEEDLLHPPDDGIDWLRWGMEDL